MCFYLLYSTMIFYLILFAFTCGYFDSYFVLPVFLENISTSMLFFKRRSNVWIEKLARSYSFIRSSSMTISVFWKALCCAWKTHWSTITQSPHLFNSMTYVGASCLSLNVSAFDSLHLDHCVSWHERTWQQQVHENVGHIVRDEQVILPPLVQQGHPSDLLLTQEVIRRHSCLLKMLFSL